MSFQQVTILGNLGKDPELKFFDDGNAVCNFSVATSRKWTDKGGEKQERTKWWNVSVRNKAAEACQKYLAKGRPVLVVGELEDREYEKDGQRQYFTVLNAREVKFVGGRQDNGGGQSGDDKTDDIPW